MELERDHNNVLAGTLGAWMGAVLGAAAVVLDSRFGGVSLIGGILLPLCVTKGYTFLGGRLGKLGAVISGLLILVMVWFANKVCFALDIMELVEGIGFFEALENVDVYQEAKVIDGYWGQLAFLYILVGAGCIPVAVGRLPKQARQPEGKMAPPLDEQPPLQGTFYALRKDWMSPLRLSIYVPLLVIMAAAIAGFLLTNYFREGRMFTALALGCFAGGIVLFLLAIPTLRLCGSFHILYVRAEGKLWRVDLQRFCDVQNWETQSERKKEAIRWDVLCEISCLLDGAPPSYGLSALAELKDLQVEKEDLWSWKCSYETETGWRKKISIAKGYPNFSPDSGLERSQEPVPIRWTAVLFSLVFAAALVGVCWAVDLPAELVTSGVISQSPGSTPEPEVRPEIKRIPARVPENITEYEMSEVWFRVDGDFKYSRRTFLDGETGTFYRAYIQYGVDASDAWDTLSQYISKYRTSPLYERFEAVCLDEEPLTPLSETSRYNIVSVYLTDGRAFHTAAVLSDGGTLFTMEAEQNSSGQTEDVLANLMFTLESVRFAGPAVTEETYQFQIHVSKIRDCAYMAAAYLKTDLFGHEAFVDVYVPYSDSPIYSAGGRAIRTEAHGLRVYAAIVPGENAKEIIDSRQQELAATGQVYEDGVEDELYREDLDAACKLTVYEENGQKRQTILYADSKWDGYYLLREITGLPELVDEDYPAALKELEEIIGLTMPVLEKLGGS